jgi:hypothetical protein
MDISRLDLPHPLGPMMQRNSCSRTVKSIPEKAVSDPNDKPRRCTVRSPSPASGIGGGPADPLEVGEAANAAVALAPIAFAGTPVINVSFCAAGPTYCATTIAIPVIHSGMR